MGSYVINFTVYTMAMIGLILFAVFVYKKIVNGGLYNNSSKFLSVEDSISLNPRKSLLVVRAGNEKFLVASDLDRTTLLSKLQNNQNPLISQTNSQIADINVNQNVNQNLNQNSNINYNHSEQMPSDVYAPKPDENEQLPVFSAFSLDLDNQIHKPVHFEPINGKNPAQAGLRRNMDRHEKYNSQFAQAKRYNNTNNSFDKKSSMMREIANRINEL